MIVVDGGRVGSVRRRIFDDESRQQQLAYLEVRVIASEGVAVYMMIMRIHVVYAVLVYTFHC